MPGGTTMTRLICGTTIVKLLSHSQTPEAANPPGGISGATGIRYFTITVDNLEEITKACEVAGYKIAVSPREIRPGITISMIEDPDRNWVELLQPSQKPIQQKVLFAEHLLRLLRTISARKQFAVLRHKNGLQRFHLRMATMAERTRNG